MLTPDTLSTLTALLAVGRDVVALLRDDHTAQVITPEARTLDLLGYEAGELTSLEPGDLVHPNDQGTVFGAFAKLAKTPGERTEVELRARHKNGRYISLRCTAVNHFGDGHIDAIVAHVSAVSEDLDALLRESWTGQPAERMMFFASVEAAVQEKNAKFWDAARHIRALVRDRRHDFMVLSVSFRNLKMLVGSYGQDTVDAMLDAVEARLHGKVQPRDTVARLDPSEFALLLCGKGDIDEAKRAAGELQRSIEAPYRIDDRDIAVKAVIGVVTSERRYASAKEVMADAAAAANHALSLDGRPAVFEAEFRLEAQRRLALVADIRRGLEENQFFLEYQPIVSIGTRKLVAFEALVRWDHPEAGRVSPGRFIPAAEESGLILPLGQWVLNEACRQMAEWQSVYEHAETMSVSVNVAAAQFGADDFLTRVEAALHSSKLAPESLKLEVTESAMMHNVDAVSRALSLLQLYGVSMSLDDFGTGYSSFSYLHQLPYDTLKIDRSFVSRMDSGERQERHRQIVAAIIGLAHQLDMEVVAEGVETSRQMGLLEAMGCDHAQGYLLDRPLSVDDATERIASEHPRSLLPERPG